MKSAASKIDTVQLRAAVRKVLAYKPPPKPDNSTQARKNPKKPMCNPRANATPGANREKS